MEHNFIWIYLLIFLAIPLARIIPRIISKARGGSYSGMQQQSDFKTPNANDGRRGDSDKDRPQDGTLKNDRTETQKINPKSHKEQTKEMVVLGELHRGARTFEDVQKNTGIEDAVLDRILEKLEDKELITVIQRKRMMGSKIELYPTDKGFREYYS